MVVIAFGILVPIYKGFGFLDQRIIAAYACLSLLFVAPASAELAAANSAGLLGRIAIIVAWGWGGSVLILATAIVTLNIVNPGGTPRRGGFVAPRLEFLAAILVFSLSASIAIAGADQSFVICEQRHRRAVFALADGRVDLLLHG